jgi:thiol-disulfide isomerase/thioredoxin
MFFLTKESELQITNKVTSLYFYSSWMPFHKRMLTMIGKIEEKHKDIAFFAIDVDYFKGLCKRFNVTSIPEVLILVNGEEAKRINGLVLTSAFKSAFADICNSCNPKTEKYHDREKVRQTS